MRRAVQDIEVCTNCMWKAAVRPATLYDRITGTRRVVCRLAPFPYEVEEVRRKPGTHCKLRSRIVSAPEEW